MKKHLTAQRSMEVEDHGNRHTNADSPVAFGAAAGCAAAGCAACSRCLELQQENHTKRH